MDKPPEIIWLFLRGLARESAHWGRFINVFESINPGSKVLTLDYPGTGKYFRGSSPSDLKGIVDVLRIHWEQARPSNPASAKRMVLGLSLGGMVSFEWLRTYPGDFDGAVLINTSLPGLSPRFDRMRPSGLAHLLSTVTTRDAVAREKIILGITSNRPQLHEKIAQEWGEIERQRPVSLINTLKQLTAALRWKPPEIAPSQPVLLLASAADRLVNPSCSVQIHEKWNFPLQWHPTAGHELPLDDPEWVSQQIADWLKSSSPDSPLCTNRL